MRVLHLLMLSGLILSVAVWGTHWHPVWGKHWHEDQDDWNWHVQHQDQYEHGDHHRDKSCYFEPRDLRVISEYYASLYPPLPHSSESKFRRNGQLPPGSEARMELIPVEVERQLVLIWCPRGHVDSSLVGIRIHERISESTILLDRTMTATSRRPAWRRDVGT